MTEAEEKLLERFEQGLARRSIAQVAMVEMPLCSACGSAATHTAVIMCLTGCAHTFPVCVDHRSMIEQWLERGGMHNIDERCDA